MFVSFPRRTKNPFTQTLISHLNLCEKNPFWKYANNMKYSICIGYLLIFYFILFFCSKNTALKLRHWHPPPPGANSFILEFALAKKRLHWMLATPPPHGKTWIHHFQMTRFSFPLLCTNFAYFLPIIGEIHFFLLLHFCPITNLSEGIPCLRHLWN